MVPTMITIKKLKISYFLILLFVLCGFTGELKTFLRILLFLLLHEGGHIFFIKLFKGDIKMISLNLVGGLMDVNLDNLPKIKRIIVYLRWCIK